MRELLYYIILFVSISSGISCNMQRYMPKGEKIYGGAKVIVQKESGVKDSRRSLSKDLNRVTFPPRNKMIFGFPYKVWFWYAIGEPKKQKGFKYWLRNKIGEPPILASVLKPSVNSVNMTAYLVNKGYFNSIVTGDTVTKKEQVKAIFHATVTHPFYFDSTEWKLDSSVLSNDIREVTKKTLLKKGAQFNLETIKAERTRVDEELKSRGYYYFSSDYILAYVDTNHKEYKTNIYFGIKHGTDAKAKRPFTINRIVVFPNYTLLKPPPDTSIVNLTPVDRIYIRDTVKQFRPQLFTRTITFRSSDKYSLKEHNKTQNRFINLGAFKFIKNRYEPATVNDTAGNLNVYYYLTPQKRKTIQFEIGGFSKTNSFTGGRLNVNWRNRNAFKGAENVLVRTYGAFEVSLTDSLRKNNNARVGAEVAFVIPRLVTPFKFPEKLPAPPKTQISAGYEWMRRQTLYSKNFFKFQYEFSWKKKLNLEQTLGLASITFNNTKDLAAPYINQLSVYPALKYITYPEIILSTFYNFLYLNLQSSARNSFNVSANAEVAGNIAGLITGAKSPFSKQLFGAWFAQYIKADIDGRYTRKLGTDFYLANRLAIGIGIPYGNSAYLPFSKQYVIGGANSLRGFRPRTVGPGSVKTSAIQRGFYPQLGGDYKLEANTELRVPVTKRIKTALFIDAGNIWTKDTLLYNSNALLTSNFLNQLAVDAGVGIRIDITFLVLRFDVAIPLRKPWLPEADRWLNKIEVSSSNWRKENLVLNIGIGYPF